jgi:hypothetical protein
MEKLAPDRLRKGREEERVVDIIVSCLIFYGDWVGWMFVYLLTWLKSSTSVSSAV